MEHRRENPMIFSRGVVHKVFLPLEALNQEYQLFPESITRYVSVVIYCCDQQKMHESAGTGAHNLTNFSIA
jgi:hypothetical protein